MTETCNIPRSNPIFWREWVSAPLRFGAIAPSSAGLARAMNEGARIGNGEVVELGPGTGVFTGELVRVGVPPERIHAIEKGPQFARLLCESMPGLHVLQGDASRLVRVLGQARLKVPLVICGLPLLSMPRRSVVRILAGSFDLIEPAGEFRLFTYGSPALSQGRSCAVSPASEGEVGRLRQHPSGHRLRPDPCRCRCRPGSDDRSRAS